jgi:hypothetical protein
VSKTKIDEHRRGKTKQKRKRVTGLKQKKHGKNKKNKNEI